MKNRDSGTSEIAIIIKAAPQVGRRHGETVCVAGIDYEGIWHRLYPVPFKDLKEYQRFDRWHRIRFDWRRPDDDDRIESKRIVPQSVEIVGKIPAKERHAFAQRAIVKDLEAETKKSRSLALIRPKNVKFRFEKTTEKELKRSRDQRELLHTQLDMFTQTIVSREPPPYSFHYDYEIGGSSRSGTCIDWETEATFFKWRDIYGEQNALDRMVEKFGNDWPKRGVAFAMGTHRLWGNWLLSGVVRVDRTKQGLLL